MYHRHVTFQHPLAWTLIIKSLSQNWLARSGWVTPANHAHNDYVEIATDYGLLGLGILGAVVGLSLWTVLKALAQRRSSLPRGIAFGVAMSITALLLHSTVDFNLQIPANALTMVVILAMGWIAQALPSSAAARGSRLA